MVKLLYKHHLKKNHSFFLVFLWCICYQSLVLFVLYIYCIENINISALRASTGDKTQWQLNFQIIRYERKVFNYLKLDTHVILNYIFSSKKTYYLHAFLKIKYVGRPPDTQVLFQKRLKNMYNFIKKNKNLYIRPPLIFFLRPLQSRPPQFKILASPVRIHL
jgi:hypothetical protein